MAAIADACAATENGPACTEGHSFLAELLATSPQAELRDGAQAVEHAERVCKLTMYANWQCLAVLAAAYAEAGKYSEAIATAEKVLTMCPADDAAKNEFRHSSLSIRDALSLQCGGARSSTCCCYADRVSSPT